MTHFTQEPKSMAQDSSILNHFTEEPISTTQTRLIRVVALLVTLFAQQSVWANGIYTFFKSNDITNRIFYSASFNENTWSDNQTINSFDSTSASLGAASFRGEIYTIWKSNDDLGKIYYSASSDGKNWPSGQTINDAFRTSAAPAAVAYGDKLYVFWKANDPSNNIYYSATSDGEKWSGSQKINAFASTSSALAAAVYNDKLYLVWKSNDISNTIYYSASSDGSIWPNGKRINNVDSTSAAPTAAVYKDKLYVVWKAGGNSNSTQINYSASNDGETWPSGQKINSSANTLAAPAAAASAGNLYILWMAGDNSGTVIYSASSDGSTWPNGKNIYGVDSTSAAPALATIPRYTGSFQCDGDGDEDGTCYSPDYTDKENFAVLYATGGNGYDFHLGPGEKAEFLIVCTNDEMNSYDVEHNDDIDCSKDKKSSRHFEIQCHNKSKSSHHDVNFIKYHCGPKQGSCDEPNQCQQPNNPGA